MRKTFTDTVEVPVKDPIEVPVKDPVEVHLKGPGGGLLKDLQQSPERSLRRS